MPKIDHLRRHLRIPSLDPATGFRVAHIGAYVLVASLLVALGNVDRALGPIPSTPAGEADALLDRPDPDSRNASALASDATASSSADLEAIMALVGHYRRSADPAWRKELAHAVYEESLLAEVDPLFVAAVVAKESSFQSRVRSSAGAVGLMQLRPWVARDVALRSSAVDWIGDETLHSPVENVRLGILYYKELSERFGGDPVVTLTAYNFGPTRVRGQLRSGTFRGSRYADEILELYDSLSTGRAGS